MKSFIFDAHQRSAKMREREVLSASAYVLVLKSSSEIKQSGFRWQRQICFRGTYVWGLAAAFLHIKAV